MANVSVEKSITRDRIEAALYAARAQADTIARGPGGRETALMITKLEEALHWLEAVKDE